MPDPFAVIRNPLGPAYDHADVVYDNVANLVQFLDAWSRDGREPALNAGATNYLLHNIVNAETSLAELRQALSPYIYEHSNQ